MSESQAGIQLTLQFVHMALRDAQLILRGGLLLRQGSSLGTGLLLLSGDDRLLLMRYIEIALQAIRPILRQRNHPPGERLLRLEPRTTDFNLGQLHGLARSPCRSGRHACRPQS